MLALGAAPALADTTIGNSSPGGNVQCVGAGEYADNGYTVPAGGGTITSLSSSGYAGQYDLQVLRPNGGGSYTVVGNTGLHPQNGGVNTYPVHITVSGGEVLGIYFTGNRGLSCGYYPRGDVSNGGDVSDPPVGTAFQAPIVFGGLSFDVSANLQPALSASGTPVSATEGQPFSGQVATFSDADNQPASAYSATINWGDGSSSSGTISQTAPGQYSVSGQHTYAEDGSYPVSVQINDSDGTSTSASSKASIADASISANGLGSSSSPVTTTQKFAGPVAQLSDQNPDGTAADSMATIDWGDGTSSTGTVTGAGGSYTVNGSHTYSQDGPYTVKVHIADDGGSTADATTYLVVYEYANSTGGGFVIGDQDTGSSVYFWGSQWSAQNPTSGGSAPASFKGFADSGAQTCGQTFAARPGDSSHPPASIPPYMAVAVTSSASKSGSHVSGVVQKLVVVKTDPSYGPDPGSPGTGQIVATICG